tara:strand:- start:302 stop:409 length:108 start_codon:yes stop_codon:yes gene_type:complete
VQAKKVINPVIIAIAAIANHALAHCLFVIDIGLLY